MQSWLCALCPAAQPKTKIPAFPAFSTEEKTSRIQAARCNSFAPPARIPQKTACLFPYAPQRVIKKKIACHFHKKSGADPDSLCKKEEKLRVSELFSSKALSECGSAKPD
ncbi:MAG: hypothetical protein SO044_01260 [Agathobaculum sp.]|uniref:hypothetical protein n=1 Tax=Agathobaculum sp. TaxID=2048138 RepID=UPI0025B9B6E2|nr:hypothetical protein [Agathobaculum sp.]MDY3711031.1 hypothetical protein [Agathobaculum sp.]